MSDTPEGASALRWVVIGALAGVVFLPWFSRGRILSYDWTTGPFDRVPASVLGATEGRPTIAPLVLARGLISHISFGVDPVAVVLVAGVFVAAAGFRRLIGPADAAAWIAATGFSVANVFVYQRLASGTFGMVLGLLLLPMVASLGIDVARDGGIARAAQLALVLAAEVALLPQFAVFGCGCALVVGAAGITRGARRAARRLRSAAFAAAGLVLVSAYWLVPTLDGGFVDYERIGPTDFLVYATRGAGVLGRLWNVLTLGGMWRNNAVSPLDRFGVPLVAFGICVAVICVGIVCGLRDPRRSRLTWSLLVLVAGSAAVSMGDRGPTGPLFRWGARHVGWLGLLREPGKAAVLIVFAYAVFFGLGVDALARRRRSSRTAPELVATGAIAIALFGVPGLAWGVGGYIRPSRPPASWGAAARRIDASPGTILALPWHQFLNYPFAQHRVVDNPTPYFFREPVLSSTDPEVPGTSSSQAEERLIGFVVNRGPTLHRAGVMLAALGVRWVLLESTIGSDRYGWLDDQSDLRLVERWPDLALYEVTEPSTTAYATTAAATVADWGGLVGLAEAGVDLRSVDVTVLDPRPGRVPPADSGAPFTAATGRPLAATDTPARSALLGRPPATGAVVFARPAEDTWRSARGRTHADLGAIVAAPAGTTAIDVSRRGASTLAIVASAVAAAVLGGLAPRRRHHGARRTQRQHGVARDAGR